MQSGIEPNILNTIVEGDCIKSLSKLPAGCVDLAFADPPFNIGYEYDVYHDKKGRDEYLGLDPEVDQAGLPSSQAVGNFLARDRR